jgi:outer membrane lipoprotein-sorting protein
MKIKLIYLVATVFVSSIGVYSSWAELTPKEILHRADEARGNLEGVRWKVSIHSVESHRTQKRKLDVKARGYDFLAVLNSPPKVKGQKLLMISHNMWFRKPDLRKPVPVSPRQKLVGGASYGDIAATNYADDYEATPLEDEIVEGELCYVFDLKASHKKATYDQIKYWVSKKRLVGVRAQYFAVSGKMFKSAVFEYDNHVQLRNKPHPFISKMIIYDALVVHNVTSMTFDKPQLVPLLPSTFDVNLF